MFRKSFTADEIMIIARLKLYFTDLELGLGHLMEKGNYLTICHKGKLPHDFDSIQSNLL